MTETRGSPSQSCPVHFQPSLSLRLNPIVKRLLDLALQKPSVSRSAGPVVVMRCFDLIFEIELSVVAIDRIALCLVSIVPLAGDPVSYTHLRAHETPEHLVCR